MTYLNSGLNLRLPHESDYNAYRRFLIANRHIGVGIYRVLRKQQHGEYKFTKEDSAPKLAQILEQKRSEELGLQYIAPHQLKPRTVIRNCPECAAQCYHNHLYQYPWITQCPIHKTTLVEQCPQCHQDWPTPGALTKTQCSTCGSNQNMLNILASRHMKDSDFIDFPKIEEAIRHYNAARKVYLFSDRKEPKGCCEHYSADVSNSLFPAYACSLDPRYKSYFDSLGIEVAEVYQRQFKLKKAKGNPSNPVNEAVLESELRRIVNEISKVIRTRSNISPGKAVSRWDDQYNRIRTVPKLLETAYKIWLSLVCNGMIFKCRSCNLVGSEYFYGGSYRAMPPEPRIMCGAIDYMDVEDIHHTPQEYYQLPPDLALWIYELDCKNLFRTIIQYLDCMNSALDMMENWTGFYDSLPRSAHPATWFEDQYSLTFTSVHCLSVIVPRYLESCDLNDLILNTESI